jgi:predicted 3-demethylubiquinone-9 3-methyltransferase (glyoxalase superfamily)
MQRLTSNLWFDSQAEEAANFYVSIFPNSKITGISHYGEPAAKASGMKKGSVMTVTFELDEQQMMALNGGTAFKFNEAVSLVVNCMTQDEIDHYWNSLTEDGDLKAQICGWLKDKYGVSWQVVPVALGEMMQDEDTMKTDRVMAALLKMKKLNIAKLKKAYLGK